MYLLVESDGADAVHSMGQHGVAASVPCCAHDTGSFVPARGHVLLYEIWMAQVRCLHGAIDSFGDERTIFRLPFDLVGYACLLYTSPSPRDRQKSRMPSSA